MCCQRLFLVKEQGLGAGSVIELTRSGLVIPKINRVIKPSETSIPNQCPSCKSELFWESDFLMCMNHENCRDQIVGKMGYFYKVLANNDGFGLATIQKLYDHGQRQVSDIYLLTQEETYFKPLFVSVCLTFQSKPDTFSGF